MKLRCIKDERAFPAGGKKTCRSELVEVVTERRSRNIKLRLNFARGSSLSATLHDVSQDREANGVPQRIALLCVLFELGRHISIFLLLSNNKSRAIEGRAHLPSYRANTAVVVPVVPMAHGPVPHEPSALRSTATLDPEFRNCKSNVKSVTAALRSHASRSFR